MAYDVWADKSALLRVEPPQLHVAFSTPFARSQAQLKERDERITKGVTIYFPGCTEVKTHDRPQQEGLETWEEKHAQDRQQQRDAFMNTLREDRVVQQVEKVLSATLHSVLLEDEVDPTP